MSTNSDNRTDLDGLETSYELISPIVAYVKNYAAVYSVVFSFLAVILIVTTFFRSNLDLGDGLLAVLIGLVFLVIGLVYLQKLSRSAAWPLVAIGALGFALCLGMLIFTQLFTLILPAAFSSAEFSANLHLAFIDWASGSFSYGILAIFFLAWYRAGRAILGLTPESAKICAEQDLARVLSRSTLLSVCGVPYSTLYAGRRRVPAICLLWFSAVFFAAASIVALVALATGSITVRIAVTSVETFLTIVFLLLVYTISLLFIGAKLRDMGRRWLRQSILDLQVKDKRPSILFLRSFVDDQVALLPHRSTLLGKTLDLGRRKHLLDVVLLEEGTEYGPVVALGKPDDPVPPYGAARGYFEHADWRQGVTALADASQAIVICLDDSEGVWWEVDNLLAQKHLDKTLFLFHPKFRDGESNAFIFDKLQHKVPRLWPAPRTNNVSFGKDGGVLGLFIAGDGRVVLGRSSTFSSIAYLLMLRWFLRSRVRRGAVDA